jgi:small subunit ribosomal protein S15
LQPINKRGFKKKNMSLTTQEKEKIFKEFGSDAKDSGSVFSQVGLFTKKISDLTQHLKENRKDYGTQRSLQIMVGKRRKLLDYLKVKDILAYRKLVKDLGLRR